MADAAAPEIDIVVGLISHDDAETVAAAAAAVQDGLRQFDEARCRVLWAHRHSTAETPVPARDMLATGRVQEIVSRAKTADLLELPYHGIPGKARALHGILTAARTLKTRACVVIDAGLETVEPQWVDQLAGPVLSHDFDFILSYYHRPPHEGALTKGLVYPLVRALYGVRLRQPAAAEFACSGRMLQRFLDEDLWDSEGAQVGIDLWLTTCAASEDFRVGETALGVRGNPARGEDALDLATTLTQVVGALFADLEDRVDRWQRMRGSVPVQQFGDASPNALPAGPPVDVERLMESYRLGYRELRDIWTWVLPPKTIVHLGRLVNSAPAEFSFDDELWARIVYDFAVGYRLRVLARDHLLRSLVPLYLGWLASFILQTSECPPEAVDERVERLAEAFEAQKAYLIARWRWPERLRT
jgi:hypothetical protein